MTAAAVPARWTSAVTLESLQNVTDTIAELTGFRAVVLNLVHGEELVVATATGFDAGEAVDGRLETLTEIIGTAWPIAQFQKLAEASIQVGAFAFLPGEYAEATEKSGWVIKHEPVDGPDAWQPEDMLTAPLHTRDGDLLGVLSLDDPISGRRPSEETIQLLSRWVGYANRVVLEALEREQLALRSRLMAQTRRALSALTSTAAEPADLLAATREKLLPAFRADTVGIRTYADPVTGAQSRFTARAGHPGDQEPVLAIAEALGRSAWERGEVPVFVAGQSEANEQAGFSPELQAWLTGRGYVGMLLAPIGAGAEAMGAIYLARQSGRAPWTDLERREALELGRDMGRILRSARALRQEQQLAAELRQVDEYRSKLIASVSYELGAPLSTIADGAARLVAAGAAEAEAIDDVSAAAHQLSRVIDDLLLLARISDPSLPSRSEPIDVAALATDAVASAGIRAEGIEVVLQADGPAVVLDGREALTRTVRALVNLAMRCTEHGGRVTITVRSTPTVVELTITDTGVGIAAEHLPRMFEEFYRLPHAGRPTVPGTGLGMAIAERTIQRCGGTVSVESAVGVGTTINVVLPVR